MLGKACRFIVLAVMVLLASALAAQTSNGPITYVYDDLGRLVGAIDINGNAVAYSYDNVGNILSISRFTAAQVSIIQFTPDSGTNGTSVTIYGTGFSTTAGQNTVKFNGTTATVTSATAGQLQVTVPAGATTGPISVTSPNGSATSSVSFTMTSSGAPSITSFSPTIGTAGTSVTLTGTNFNSLLADNRITLNASPAVISSGTSTTLVTSIPAATASGRFSLITPAGTAVSSQDLYVPFLAHSVTDIGYTARISIGGSQIVTLAANKIGMVLFDGAAGQHVSITVTGSTISNCNLYLIAPDNTTVTTNLCESVNSPVSYAYLQKTGTYTIGIDPSTSSGSLTVSVVSDVTGTVTINGPPVTVQTTVVGQDARLNFTATAGQRIVVYVTNVTNRSAVVNLVTPAATIQAYFGITSNQQGQTFYLDTQTLATAGTYQLWVQHSSTYVGSETLQIASVPPDFTSPITVPAAGATGAAVRIPATGNLAVGQNAILTFNGTSGQKLSFNVLNPAIGTASSNCVLTVKDPSGNALVSGYCGPSSASFIDTVTLAATGTFSILVDPQGTATGSGSLSINNDSDITGTATIDGSAVTMSTTAAGQDVRLSFTANAGQRIVVYATSVTNPSAVLNLVTPTGTTQASMGVNNNPAGQTFYMDTQTLSTTGTYQLWVQHVSTNFGSETLQIASVPADFSSTITVPAAGQTSPSLRVPTTGNLSVGQNGILTFSGTSGQKLSFNVSNPAIGTAYYSCTVTVKDPNGNAIASGYCGPGAGSYIDTVTLSTTGNFSILVNPQGAATGSVSLSINNAADATGTITIDGSAVTTGTTAAGQDARLSFTATGAQRIFVYATSVTNPSAVLNLVTPSGTTQASRGINNSPAGQTFFIDTQTLGTTGTYQLWVQHVSANFGSEALQIASVPPDQTGTVTIGGAACAVSTVPGQNASITFSNPQSQSVTVHWSGSTYPSTLGCSLNVTGPSPSTTQVGHANCNTATTTLGLGTLASGTYTILVDPQAQSAGGLSLTVTTP